MFVGLHALLAERTQTPELVLSEEEGDQFMKSAQKVMRHYSVETTQKTLDFIAFFGTVASIYGTRIAAIGIRKRGEQQERNNPIQDNVIFPFGLQGGIHQQPHQPNL